MHGHYADMSAESYISYCDGQHSTLVQFVLMLSVNHSLAKARPTMRCIRLVIQMIFPCITIYVHVQRQYLYGQSCYQSRRHPRQILWRQASSKACIISMGNECMAVTADMFMFVVTFCPILPSLHQWEQLLFNGQGLSQRWTTFVTSFTVGHTLRRGLGTFSVCLCWKFLCSFQCHRSAGMGKAMAIMYIKAQAIVWL